MKFFNKTLRLTVTSYRVGLKITKPETTENYLRCRANLFLVRQTRALHSGQINCADRKKTTPVFLNAYNHPSRIAVVDDQGKHTYGDILRQAHSLSQKLMRVDSTFTTRTEGNTPPRVCILCPNDVSYVIAQWASWMAGGIVVPLCTTHPPNELKYFVEDSDCKVIVATECMVQKIEVATQKLDKTLVVLKKHEYHTDDFAETEVQSSQSQLDVSQDRWTRMTSSDMFKSLPAMIVYTSGTTGRPKGVVHTYGSLMAQMDDMTDVWEWKSSDVILHTLPLHHIHGIVNVLMTPLYNGATCVMLPKFDPEKVWSKLVKEVNMFMAVPTIYAKLIEHYEKKYQQTGQVDSMRQLKEACEQKVRLMVSGSAALPEPIMARWEQITGHRLLERYGMTELGMALTNPLRGSRIPGSVGKPFPGVEVAIGKPVDGSNQYEIFAQGNQHSTTLKQGFESESGELLVRGPNVFLNYWQRPDATAETFTSDGWFKTGDTACHVDGAYKILGRTSVDIIKSGGYKISALDIERYLLSHENITEVAVIGLPDETFGQKIAAVLVLTEGFEMSLDELRNWCKDRMPKYQMPAVLKVLNNIQRNAMGKVNKKELAKQVFPDEMKASS